MLIRSGEPLSAWTTLRLGGPARTFLEASSREELYDAVRRADVSGDPLLVIGGGSNLVVADAGVPGTVVRAASRGVAVTEVDEDAVALAVEAGEDWDTLVERAVSEKWQGIEALAGIPGSVGAVPVQNVGAYGQEVAETITAVAVWDRREQRERRLTPAECRFGYRTSVFKAEPGRFVVGAVTFRLRRRSPGPVVGYAELARRLDVPIGETAPAPDVRTAVLDLRRSKGMVLDAADSDTWSVGSFFTNPFVEPDRLPPGAPAFPQPDGQVKTSAAWLLEKAGVQRGERYRGVGVSTKHILALINGGEGTTADLLRLAAHVRSRVQEAFGIRLDPEPTLVNCSLPDPPLA